MKTKVTRRVLAMLIAFVMLLSLVPATVAAELPFTDVPTGSWYYDSVSYAYENELMVGMTDTTFAPNGTVTRAMAVAVLYRLDGEPETDAKLPFADVPENAYYADAVKWGVENGIVAGMSETTFAPNSSVTREQLAAFVYRYAKYADKDLTTTADLAAFPDVDDVKYYALDALEWAVGTGIIYGIESGKESYLAPEDNTTRAQLAAILMRVAENTRRADEYSVLQIFETTDIHGYIVNTASGKEETYQYRMAYLANIFNEARADEAIDDVILLDSGDIYQGTALSNLTYGNAMRAAFDAMGYDAVSLGNHEFDWDVTLYATDANATVPAYKIGDFEGDSDTPVLAFNLNDAGTTNRASIVGDYTILEKDGHKIAVIGYIPNYRGDIMAAKIAPYDIDEDLEDLKALVAAVNEKENPTATIVLAHDGPSYIAAAMDPEQVDLVLGGHTHGTATGVAENGVPYTQGGCQAQGYSAVTLTINNWTGEVTVGEPAYVSITGKEDIEKLYDTEGSTLLDPTVLAISKAAIAELAEQLGTVLGYVDQNITRSRIEGSRTTIAGNFITGLMLHATKDLGTVAAFANSGGIRCEFLMEEGATTRNITVGDIYTISPFGNRLMTYEVTGAELAAFILSTMSNSNLGDQMSGLVATYYVDADGNKVINSITLDDGTVVDITDTTTTYRIVTYEYCATLPDSVLLGKTPVQDINVAPIDNESAIVALKEIAAANDGKIPLDVTAHFYEVEAPTN